MSVAWRRTLEWAPALAAGLFALAAARAWGAPATGSPLWLAALGLAALAAAFHRPFGGAGLGLGAAVLPLA
ncbi:MAG TPA: EamA family transporter, partial [Thermoanaerobaculia bacterium]|nr:EamA family transporter [Thermoanaerobaculia bacterium]